MAETEYSSSLESDKEWTDELTAIVLRREALLRINQNFLLARHGDVFQDLLNVYATLRPYLRKDEAIETDRLIELCYVVEGTKNDKQIMRYNVAMLQKFRFILVSVMKSKKLYGREKLNPFEGMRL